MFGILRPFSFYQKAKENLTYLYCTTVCSYNENDLRMSDICCKTEFGEHNKSSSFVDVQGAFERHPELI